MSNIDNRPSWLRNDPTPGTETDVIDDYNVHPITGAERPDDFMIGKNKALHDIVTALVDEIPWLEGEGYEWMQEDIDWCLYLLVSVALATREPLARLIESLIVVYRDFERNEFRDPRSRVPEHDALLGELGGAAWEAVRRGVSEQEITDRVRKSVDTFRVQEAHIAAKKARQSGGTPYDLNDAPLQSEHRMTLRADVGNASR